MPGTPASAAPNAVPAHARVERARKGLFQLLPRHALRLISARFALFQRTARCGPDEYPTRIHPPYPTRIYPPLEGQARRSHSRPGERRRGPRSRGRRIPRVGVTQDRLSSCDVCVFSSPMRQRSSAVWAYSWAARAAFTVQRSAIVARTARVSLSICSNSASVRGDRKSAEDKVTCGREKKRRCRS